MPTSPENLLAVIVWPKGIDFTHERHLIEKGYLQFNRLGGQKSEFIYLTRDAVVEEYTTAQNTTHWYRGMPKSEFDQLFKWNMLKDSDDAYTGIAPNRAYVKTKFFTNGSPGTHIVEFGNSLNLSIDEDFSVYRAFHNLGFSLKAEGGGTYGLGGQGSPSAVRSNAVAAIGTEKARKGREVTPEQLSLLKTPSDLFTEWLTAGKIYRKLVDLRLPARSNSRDILEV